MTSNDPTAWAVFLGCTTASRLAAEWRISTARAERFLRLAVMDGSIIKVAPGVFQVAPTRAA